MKTGPGDRVVAITGLGVLSCAGIGTEAFWNGLNTDPPEGERERRVPNFDPTPLYGPKEVRRVDRFAQFAMAAATMALEDAGGAENLGVDPGLIGVIIGTGVGGLETLEDQIVVRHEKGPRRVSPFLVPMMMANAGAAGVSMRFGFQGPCETVVTACAAGTQSIGYAARLVAMGRCDIALGGGSEAAMTPTGIAGFANMTALSTSGNSRPFDAERDGFVISEGAGVLVLEELEHAKARGAHIYGIVMGAASNADAHHITAPSPGGAGAAQCMQLALSDAGITPADIGHINAHGTSTPLNDAAEAEAITKVFGTPGPPVTSIKGVTGHSLGAAGAVEAVSIALSIEKKLIPPTMGFHHADAEITIDVVANQARPWEPAPVLSNSFGFGGHNGCLVIAPA